MTELGPESEALLAEERAQGDPTADELESRRLGVFAAIGVEPPPIVGADAPTGAIAPPAAPSSLASISGTKLAITIGLVTIASTAYVATRSAEEPRSSPPVLAPVASSVAPAVVAPEAPPATEEIADPVESPPPVSARTAERTERATMPFVPVENQDTPAEDPPTPEDSLSEESMLIAAAEAQLRAGHAAAALSLYDRALARHPSGALRAEALAGRVASLCRAGRVADGQRELERFVASYPRSPSGPRLRALCGGEP